MKCCIKESASAKIHRSAKTRMKMYGNQGVTVLTWCTARLKVMEMLKIVKAGPRCVVCCSPRGEFNIWSFLGGDYSVTQ